MPGAFELPLGARYCAESGRYAGVACLGAVIRGETDHYDFVCAEAASGIARVGARHRRAVLVRRADRGQHGAGARAHRRREAPPGRGRRARGAADGGAAARALRMTAACAASSCSPRSRPRRSPRHRRPQTARTLKAGLPSARRHHGGAREVRARGGATAALPARIAEHAPAPAALSRRRDRRLVPAERAAGGRLGAADAKARAGPGGTHAAPCAGAPRGRRARRDR